MIFIAMTTANAQYSNATLNGPWLIYQNPLTPYNDSLVYIIFDGNGSITDFGGFGTFSGNYSVNTTGAFSGILNSDEGSFPLSGQLNSQNTATMGDRILSKVSNPGALSGTITGFLNSECGVEFVILTVDNQGNITGATGLAAPVSGRIYSDLGVYIGHIKTGVSDIWNEFSMMGYYSDNTLWGKVGLDANDCQSSVTNLIHSGETKIVEINSITPGALFTTLNTDELNTVTNLKLKGSIDARDFKTMRDLMPALRDIDISGANIVEYTGTEGTYDASNRTYRANTIPRNGLMDKIILKNILLPNSLTVIGYNAFRNCTSLSNIDIPTSVNTIDISAFRGCISLSQVDIPSSVTDIKYAAFSESGLNQITLNEGLISIGEFAFSHCFSLSGDVNIPASVTLIGKLAFLVSNVYFNVNPSNVNYSSENGILYDKNKTIIIYCPTSLSGNFNIPSTVNTIDVDAFYNCNQITNINLPASLTKIREWAFENCTGLTTISIPSGVTMIKGFAFYNCSGLTSIYANPTTPVDLSASDSVFKHINVVDCKLYVPVGSKSLYQNAIQWKDFQNIIEEDNTVDLTNGLIAFYPFNGNANDESGNSNGGTVYSASLTEDRFGIANRAFHFNGSSDYIAIDGIVDDLFNKDSYSVTGWFQMNDKSHKGTIFSVNREKDVFGQNISMITWADNLTYYGDFMSEVKYYDTSFDTNTWYFFALTFTKNQLSHLYVDNNLLHQTFINNMDITMSSMASIGQEWDNTMISDLFSGKIDDIRVYNRILNSSERSMLYFDNTTGIHDVKNTQISISPNPADNGFYLPTNVSVDNISIYDIRGVLVHRALNTNNYVDVSKLQKGIYIVQLQAKEGTYQVKLIKK